MTDINKTDAVSSPKAIYLKDYKKPDYQLDSVDLHFELHETQTRVSSSLVFSRAHEANTNASLTLDGSHLELQELKLDGEILASDRYAVNAAGRCSNQNVVMPDRQHAT